MLMGDQGLANNGGSRGLKNYRLKLMTLDAPENVITCGCSKASVEVVTVMLIL